MTVKADRTGSRADRLHREAMNCVSFAIRERDIAHAADLIDEAIKLKRRSEELADDGDANAD